MRARHHVLRAGYRHQGHDVRIASPRRLGGAPDDDVTGDLDGGAGGQGQGGQRRPAHIGEHPRQGLGTGQALPDLGRVGVPLRADGGPHRGRRDERGLGSGDDLGGGQRLQGLRGADRLGLLALGVVRRRGGVGSRLLPRARRGRRRGPVGAPTPTPRPRLRLGIVREHTDVAGVGAVAPGVAPAAAQGLEEIVGVLPHAGVQQLRSGRLEAGGGLRGSSPLTALRPRSSARLRDTPVSGVRVISGGHGTSRISRIIGVRPRDGLNLPEPGGLVPLRLGHQRDRFEQRGLVTGFSLDDVIGVIVAVGALAGQRGPRPGAPRPGRRARRSQGPRRRRPHCGQVGAPQGLEDTQPRIDGDVPGAGSGADDGDPVDAVGSQRPVRQAREPLGQRNAITGQREGGHWRGVHCAS